MQILYLMPGQVEEEEIERREKIANNLVSDDTEVTVEGTKKGPLSIEYAPEEYMAVPPVLNRLYDVQDKFDAAIIGCFGDPGLRAARELIDIPVIGPAESSFYLSLMVGENFSIITILESVRYATEAQLKELGIKSHCTSIRTLGIPVLELGDDEEKTLTSIEELSKEIYEEEKASTIILGCMSEAFLLADEKIESKIPIINPAKASLRMAELFVNTNLTHSSVSYPEADIDKLKKANLL